MSKRQPSVTHSFNEQIKLYLHELCSLLRGPILLFIHGSFIKTCGRKKPLYYVLSKFENDLVL